MTTGMLATIVRAQTVNYELKQVIQSDFFRNYFRETNYAFKTSL